MSRISQGRVLLFTLDMAPSCGTWVRGGHCLHLYRAPTAKERAKGRKVLMMLSSIASVFPQLRTR